MKPTVRVAKGIVIKGGRILLMFSFKHQAWTLPGGKIDPGEGTEEAMKREFLEELGVEAVPEKFIFRESYDSGERIIDGDVWTVEIKGEPENKEPEKTREIKWFPLSQPPKEKMLPFAERAFEVFGK